MLLWNDKLSWEWNDLLHSILSLAENLTKKIKKESSMFEDFIAKTFSKGEISKIVSNINSNITISISSNTFSAKNIEMAVKMLDILSLANDKKPHKERLPYKDFNNDAINNEVNLK